MTWMSARTEIAVLRQQLSSCRAVTEMLDEERERLVVLNEKLTTKYVTSASKAAEMEGIASQLARQISEQHDMIRELVSRISEISARPPSVVPAPDTAALISALGAVFNPVADPAHVAQSNMQAVLAANFPETVPADRQFIPAIEMVDQWMNPELDPNNLPTKGGWYNPTSLTATEPEVEMVGPPAMGLQSRRPDNEPMFRTGTSGPPPESAVE